MSERKQNKFREKIVTAIQARELGQFLRESVSDGPDCSLYEQAQETLQRIRQDCLDVGKESVVFLKQHGIRAKFDSQKIENSCPQFQSVDLVLSETNPTRAVSLLEEEGFYSPFSHSSGAWHAYRRVRGRLTLTRKDEVATRLNLHWEDSKLARSALRKFCPSEFDGEFWKLPSLLWPLAYFAKPWRILGERIGWRREKNLGHWLATPDSLLRPIFEEIDLNADDVLLDLGSGDGRVLIASAEYAGCRAIGLEINERLVMEARERVNKARLKNLISVEHGGIDQYSVSDETVVFLFLPASIIARILPNLLASLGTGARVIAHEQSRLQDLPVVPESIPIFGDRSLSVLSVWRKTESSH